MEETEQHELTGLTERGWGWGDEGSERRGKEKKKRSPIPNLAAVPRRSSSRLPRGAPPLEGPRAGQMPGWGRSHPACCGLNEIVKLLLLLVVRVRVDVIGALPTS